MKLSTSSTEQQYYTTNRSKRNNIDVSKQNHKTVTLPDGVQAGDGRLNTITIPEGMGPGSTFTVEFSVDTPPPPKEEELTPGVYVPTVVAEPEVEMGVPYGGGGDGMETAVAKPTTGPYVPASYAS